MPVDRELYQGKYLYVLYSREDEQISFSYPSKIQKNEWEDFKKELEAVINLEIR